MDVTAQQPYAGLSSLHLSGSSLTSRVHEERIASSRSASVTACAALSSGTATISRAQRPSRGAEADAAGASSLPRNRLAGPASAAAAYTSPTAPPHSPTVTSSPPAPTRPAP